MTNATALRTEGFKILSEKLGILEAEHFIALIKREPFDYTQWREDLYKDVPLDDFLSAADNFRKNKSK
ncbi:hypothetical protein AGMMS49546_16910 [Spirochaetia bacterium]|nr:hypothetical protein AGMMS49546_16910 [Spirochaetia bacterium]